MTENEHYDVRPSHVKRDGKRTFDVVIRGTALPVMGGHALPHRQASDLAWAMNAGARTPEEIAAKIREKFKE